MGGQCNIHKKNEALAAEIPTPVTLNSLSTPEYKDLKNYLAGVKEGTTSENEQKSEITKSVEQENQVPIILLSAQTYKLGLIGASSSDGLPNKQAPKSSHASTKKDVPECEDGNLSGGLRRSDLEVEGLLEVHSTPKAQAEEQDGNYGEQEPYATEVPKIVTSNKQIEIKAPQNVDYPPANDLSAESVDVDKVINLDKRSRNKYETLDGVDSELESDEHPSQSDKVALHSPVYDTHIAEHSPVQKDEILQNKLSLSQDELNSETPAYSDSEDINPEPDNEKTKPGRHKEGSEGISQKIVATKPDKHGVEDHLDRSNTYEQLDKGETGQKGHLHDSGATTEDQEIVKSSLSLKRERKEKKKRHAPEDRNGESKPCMTTSLTEQEKVSDHALHNGKKQKPNRLTKVKAPAKRMRYGIYHHPECPPSAHNYHHSKPQKYSSYDGINSIQKSPLQKYTDLLSLVDHDVGELEHAKKQPKLLSYGKIMGKIRRQRQLSALLLKNLKRPLSKSLSRTLKKYYARSKRVAIARVSLSDFDSGTESFASDTNYSDSEHSEMSGPSDVLCREQTDNQLPLSISSPHAQNLCAPNSMHQEPQDKFTIADNKTYTKNFPKHKNNARNRIPPKFWTAEENGQLLAAVQKYGNQWGRVSSAVKNRSSRQCKEHWTRVLSKRKEAIGVNARVIAKHSKARETEKLLKQWKDYQKLFTENYNTKKEPHSGSNDTSKSSFLPSSNIPPSNGNLRKQHEYDKHSSSKNDRLSVSERELSNDSSLSELSSYDEYLNLEASVSSEFKHADFDRGSPRSADRSGYDSRNEPLYYLNWRNQNSKSDKKTIKIGYWLPEEDRALVAAHARLGSRWIQVANIIPGRTKRQCERRFRRLREKLKKQVINSDGITSLAN